MSQNSFKSHILPAVIQSLIIAIVRLFTIPWHIWYGAMLRLSEKRTAPKSDSEKSSEFPVFEWFKSLWDATIFLAWFVSILIAIGTFLSIVSWSFMGAISAAIGVLISGYFSVILMSLAKETLILVLSIALNVEQISKSKSQSSPVNKDGSVVTN